jgi:protein-disulfide isomerase
MSENNSSQGLQALSVPISIVIAGAIIGACLIVAFKGTSSAPAAALPGQPQPSAPVDVKVVDIEGHPYIGKENAPVTLVAWEDFQCGFCKRFEVEVLPTIVKNYVDTGKVKIVFKDYQFLGPNSTLAGEWARAIWALYPAKYFEWRTAFYTSMPPENTGTADGYEAHLAKVSSDVGINAAAIKADLAKNRAAYSALLTADQAEATQYGINGTPGFITGEVKIDGAQPLANFVAAFDAQL